MQQSRNIYVLWQLGETLFLRRRKIVATVIEAEEFLHRQSFHKVSAQLATCTRRRFGSNLHLNLQIQFSLIFKMVFARLWANLLGSRLGLGCFPRGYLD